MSSLSGRVAVVTGASSGLGAAIAKGLAAQGAAVVGFARRFSATLLDGAPVAGRVTELQLDVTDEAAVRDRFRALGGVDILVSCAGDAVFKPFSEMSAAELRQMLDAHIVGAFLCARAALTSMKERGGGHIVNVSSVAAFRTFPSCSGYTAAKEGMRGLTRVLAEEVRPFDVRVTGFYPGAIDTPIWDGRDGFDRSAMMRPDDVAGLVVDIVGRRSVSVEEILVFPPAGSL